MKKRQRCVHCDSLKTKRNGVRMRLRQEALQKFYCRGCKKVFTLGSSKRSRLSRATKINLTRTHLEGRTSIRQIVRDTGYAKQTIQNAIHEVTASCVDSAWIASHLRPDWGGYVAVDGLYVRVYDRFAKYFPHSQHQRKFIHKIVWLVALDLKTLDIVHHHLGDEETMIDLILFWSQVKRNGYPLKGLVSDGNRDIMRSAKRVYDDRKIAYQLCVRHFLEGLREKLRRDKVAQWDYGVFQAAIQTKTSIRLLPKGLFTYLQTPKLPRTNQQIENLFKQVRLRLNTIGIFHSYQTAFNYLNAWTLWRRFTPFTDSRDCSKNGRAPLELAGCNIRDLDYFRLH